MAFRTARSDVFAGSRLTPSRVLLTTASVMTVVGSAMADLTRTHVFNPSWPGHARFHNVAGWGTITGSQVLALWLLWRPHQSKAEQDLAVITAAWLPTLAWAPFFLASITPGTTIGDDPEHLPEVAGIPANLIPASVFPALAGCALALHRRGH